MGMADISKENRKINYMTFTNPSHEEDEIRELQLETLINMFRIILSSLLSGRAGCGGGGGGGGGGGRLKKNCWEKTPGSSSYLARGAKC